MLKVKIHVFSDVTSWSTGKYLPTFREDSVIIYFVLHQHRFEDVRYREDVLIHEGV